MIISIIAAMGKNRCIGVDGGLPWSLPREYAAYKERVAGKYVVVGRKNFEYQQDDCANSTPLVVSRQAPNSPNIPAGVKIFNTIETAFQYARCGGADELFVIGGGEIYQLALPYCHRLYLTIVDCAPAGDTVFPEYYQEYDWRMVSETPFKKDEQNPHGWVVQIMEKEPSPFAMTV